MDAPRPTKDFARRMRKQMSLPEVILWDALRRQKLSGLKFRRQHPLGPYVLDFYCHARRLAVEVDGGSHSFGDQPSRDRTRDAWLATQGIRTVRLSAELILGDVDDAIKTLFGHLERGDTLA